MKLVILALFAIIAVTHVSGRPLEESDSSAPSPLVDSENKVASSGPEGGSIDDAPTQIIEAENTICFTFPPKPTTIDQSPSNTPGESSSTIETGQISEESDMVPYGKTICFMVPPKITVESPTEHIAEEPSRLNSTT